jgi:hypothetical protein
MVPSLAIIKSAAKLLRLLVDGHQLLYRDAKRPQSASGRPDKKAMAMGPELREDPASIGAEEQARRRRRVADQWVPSEWVRAAAW